MKAKLSEIPRGFVRDAAARRQRGATWKELAQYFRVSESALRKRVKEYQDRQAP